MRSRQAAAALPSADPPRARVAARGAPPAGAARPLRIGIMMQNSGWGGLELHTLEVTRQLISRGHAVTLVEIGWALFDDHPVPRELGVRVVHFDLGKRPEAVSFREWRRVLRTLECDVMVFSKGWTSAGNLALDFAARRTFRRYLTIEHITPPAWPPRRAKRYYGVLPGFWWWRKMFLDQGPRVYARSLAPQLVIGVSHAVAEELRAYGFPRRKLRPIPNGIDSDRYRPDAAHRAAARAAWGVPDTALVFGTVGRLILLHKGLDVAVALFARLVAANPGRDLRYVLVGDGPDRAALERQVAALGLSERVVFAGHTDRPWEAHPGLDVFVMSSHFEGIGLALLEAMASGAVPIAFGVGGVRDVIADPSLGWLIPPGDREAMLRAMQAAADQPVEARTAMARRCRDHVIAHYRAAEQYRKVVELIEGD